MKLEEQWPSESCTVMSFLYIIMDVILDYIETNMHEYN